MAEIKIFGFNKTSNNFLGPSAFSFIPKRPAIKVATTVIPVLKKASGNKTVGTIE